MKALDYASRFTKITQQDRHIIIHSKRSLLYHQNSPWTKKNSDSTFDVTMGSYDGTEAFELIGVYMLSLIAPKLDSIVTTGLQYVRPRQEKLKKQSKKSAMFLNLTVLK